MVKIKEISLNDLVAVIMAAVVVIVAIIVKDIPTMIVPVLTGFLGLIGGYIGARNINKNDDREIQFVDLGDEEPVDEPVDDITVINDFQE